jgi:hypothetical protein
MSRLATRKTAKSRYAAKRGNTGIGTPNKMHMNAIDNFLNKVNTVAKQRKAKNGASDAVAKKLNWGAANARGQFRKTNFLNPNMTKYLHDIGYSLRGVKVSSAVKAELPRIFRNLREGVRKDVVLFLGTLNRNIRSMTYEFTKWETILRRNYGSVKAGTKKYTIDPAIRRQILSFEKQIGAFKTKWNKLLGSLSTHGNVQVQAAVRMIKRELEGLQKSIRTNRVLINSIVKTSKGKKYSKVRAQALITKGEFKKYYNNWLKKQKMFNNFRNSIYSFVDQLKAIKTC